jgi:maleylacetoacetate isomerase
MTDESKSEIVLHDYWRSSAAYRVRIALNLLGLPYQTVPVDLAGGDQRGAANLARNPQGLVPTLQIDGHSLIQSLAILEYLDETHAPGWLPSDAAGRAETRAIAHAIAMDIHPVCNLRVARYAVSLGATMESWMQHFIGLGLEGVEALLARKPSARLCCGDKVTMADICLVPQVYNARRWGVDMAAFARIQAIDAVLAENVAFQQAHPDKVKPGA